MKWANDENSIWVAKKQTQIIVATDDWSREIIAKLPVNKPFQAAFRQRRNLAMHRKLWALIHTVWQSTGGNWLTPYETLKELKRRMGFYEDIVDQSTGFAYREYRSISFAKMDQTAFNTFFEQALEHMCEIGGGIENKHLRQAVLDELLTQ